MVVALASTKDAGANLAFYTLPRAGGGECAQEEVALALVLAGKALRPSWAISPFASGHRLREAMEL